MTINGTMINMKQAQKNEQKINKHAPAVSSIRNTFIRSYNVCILALCSHLIPHAAIDVAAVHDEYAVVCDKQ